MANQGSQQSTVSTKEAKENKIMKALTVIGKVLLVPVVVPQQEFKENKTLWSKLTLNVKKFLGTAAIIWAWPFLAVYLPRTPGI